MNNEGLVSDMIGRAVYVGDYVVSNNLIYEVQALLSQSQVQVKLLKPSKTTRPVIRYSDQICRVDKGDVMFYLLKKQ